MASHTPGPWKINPASGVQIVSELETLVICTTPGDLLQPAAARNAHLIAAAPEMYEALKKLRLVGECWCQKAIGNPMYLDHSELCKEVSAVLAKAEGKQS
jgi:hypothetical protein